MGSEKKVALVTGGIGGIGTAICQRLARDGCCVVATHIAAETELAKAWQEARVGEGLDTHVTVVDVSSAEDCVRMAREIEQQFGPIQVLVNCAGITRDKVLHKMEAKDWDAVIATNLNSVFYVTRPIWEGMRERGYGRIVNISSVNGQRGQFGQTNYSAAKAGMHGFTMALAQEGAAKGITVNTVSPGYIETSMTAAMRDDVRQQIVAGVPMKRMGRPEEIAAVVGFLAGDACPYLTGANIPVNGGLFIK